MITKIEFGRSRARDENGNPNERRFDIWRHRSVTEDVGDCPLWQVQADNFLDDPITVSYGVGGEMLPLLRRSHREKCPRCSKFRYWTVLWNIGFHFVISNDPIYRTHVWGPL